MKSEDNFKDIVKFNEKSLKKVWNNKEDDIWKRHLTTNEKKIKCDCGEVLVEKKTLFDSFDTDAMVCTKCNFTTLTKQQAEEYVKL